MEFTDFIIIFSMLSVFFAIIAAPVVLSIVLYSINQKYDKFIKENSTTLKELISLNEKYDFCKIYIPSMQHTYDNEAFYSEISCRDYLIYQLQFEYKKILQAIGDTNKNKEQYVKYREELRAIAKPGTFSAPHTEFKFDKLLKKEKIILAKTVLKPIIEYSITVVLYHSKINGSLCSKKSMAFNQTEIWSLINRLKNKSGRFYNEKEIWDALCRVERGRVSNAMRFSIYRRDGYRCRYCGASGNYTNLEIDHIYPISKGGKSEYSNLQTLCHRCNKAKGSSTTFHQHFN